MHDHIHPHQHAHGQDDVSPEEVLALLKYMLEHNRHHADELHDLAHQVPEDVEQILHQALEQYGAANDKLAEALQRLTKE